MKKKHILIISIFVILIIASIVTMSIMKGTDGSNSTFDPLNNNTLQNWDVPDALPDESYDNIANSMGISREELDELITTPLDLTPEQEAAIEKRLDESRPPEIAEFTEDDNPNDNIYTYVDTNGDVGTMTLNTPNLADEENAEYEMGRQAVRIVENYPRFFMWHI